MTEPQSFMQILRRFSVTGIIGVVAFYAIYYPLMWSGVWYVLASMPAFALQNRVKFWLQKRWTFNNQDRQSTSKQSSQFIVMDLTLFLVYVALLYALVEYAHIGEKFFAPLVATFVVSVLSFLWTSRIFRS